VAAVRQILTQNLSWWIVINLVVLCLFTVVLMNISFSRIQKKLLS
jgi:hypothetical protein